MTQLVVCQLPIPNPTKPPPSENQPPNRRTALLSRVPNRKSCYQLKCPKRIRFRHPLVTTAHATTRMSHLTKANFHYSNEEIRFFKLRSRDQGEVPLKPRPEWDIDQATKNNKKGATDKGAARGYAEFKLKNVIRREKAPKAMRIFENPRYSRRLCRFSIQKG